MSSKSKSAGTKHKEEDKGRGASAKKAKESASEEPEAESSIESKLMEEFDAVQESLDQLEGKQADEVIAINQKYSKLKRPIFKKRAEVIKKVPHFWARTLQNCDEIASMMEEIDSEIFKYLEVLDVEEHDDIKTGFKVSMTFASNPFFSNASVSKEFTFDETGDCKVAVSPIKWTDKSFPKKNKDCFFVTFFDAEEPHIEFAEVLRDDVFPNPLAVFMGGGSGDVEIVDGEGEDDEEEAPELVPM